MSDLVLIEPLEPGVSGVVLNRAERRNALGIDLLQQLHEAIERLEADRSQRVLVLRGAGPVFSAGLDLKEAADPDLVERSAECVEQALLKLRGSPLVTVAAVHGGAFAGGAGVMAACDVVIAAADARFGFPEARRGLLPALICDIVQHKVREGDLRELFLVGDPITAARAQQVGLVQRVVPADRLQDEALALARSILAGGPETIRLTKQLLNDIYHPAEMSRGGLVAAHLEARRHPEAIEGLKAFIEKRDPVWGSGDVAE